MDNRLTVPVRRLPLRDPDPGPRLIGPAEAVKSSPRPSMFKQDQQEIGCFNYETLSPSGCPRAAGRAIMPIRPNRPILTLRGRAI